MIAGSARGRHLKGPPGRARGRTSDARPSSDLVRGALFDALSALGADFTHTLDLYAGTGALGIEAMSRGAQSCQFVEKNRAMAAVIRENVAALGFNDASEVIVAPVERAIGRLAGPFTLVLADPPYADAAATALLQRLAQSGAIDGDYGTIVFEHSTREEAAAAIGAFLLVRSLRHGDSSVSIYRPD